MSLVTVIIPTYNRRPFLERAIDSVRSQSFTSWQLIVVDDGSTDGSCELVAEISKKDPRISCIRQENRGVSAARNRGINEVSSGWVAFLDSDDVWLKDKLEMQLDLAKVEPQLKWIHTEENWIRSGQLVNKKRKFAKQGGRQFLRCVELCCVGPSTVMIDRSVFDELGVFKNDFPICEDYELWLRISARYPIGLVSKTLIEKHGGHADQLSTRYRAMDYWRVKALLPFLENKYLSVIEAKAVFLSIIARCELLLLGYKKHGHGEKFNEVLAIKNRVEESSLSALLLRCPPGRQTL